MQTAGMPGMMTLRQNGVCLMGGTWSGYSSESEEEASRRWGVGDQSLDINPCSNRINRLLRRHCQNQIYVFLKCCIANKWKGHDKCTTRKELA